MLVQKKRSYLPPRLGDRGLIRYYAFLCKFMTLMGLNIEIERVYVYMKKEFKLFGVLLCVMLFIAGCGCSKGSLIVEKEVRRRESTGDSWTVMLYMGASALDENDTRATEVLNSISYDLPKNINVVIEINGDEKWGIEGIKSGKLQDFIVQKNGLREIYETGVKNMGEAKTYADFLNRTIEKYPADKYISIIWGESGGPLSGVAHDAANKYDSLAPSEIAAGLASTETKLDLIGFDTGMMANLDVAATLVPYADYMVASEDIMPESGWDYRKLLEYISENPNVGAAQAGQIICDSAYERASDQMRELMIMSVIDLSDITSLAQGFDTLAHGLAADCEDIDKLRSMTARINSAHFVGANAPWEGYSNLVDLKSFQNAGYSAVRSNYARIEKTISRAVIYKMAGELHDDSCGISVYYPKSRDAREINEYKKLCTSSGYKEFIDKIMADDAIADRTADYKVTPSYEIYQSALENNTMTAEPDLSGKYLLSVDNPDVIAMTGVNLYKYDEETGMYLFLRNDNDTYYSNIANTYEYQLNNKVIELNKIPVSVYKVNDYGESEMYSIPIIYKDKLSSLRVLAKLEDSKRSYSIVGIWEGYNSETGILDSSMEIPSAGDSIIPIYETYGGDDGSYLQGKKLTLVFGGLNIKDKSISDGEYLLSYTAEDVYGNKKESNTTNVTAIKGKMQITK